MGAVALLPEEFSGAEEHARAHLPAHNVGPLVAEYGQIAVTVYPVAVGAPYYCFRCRTHYKFLFEARVRIYNHSASVRIVFQTIMGHYGALFGKAFHMFGFTLHFFPDGVAVGLDDHASSHRRLFGKVGFYNEVVVPLRIVVGSLGEVFEFCCHFRMLR